MLNCYLSPILLLFINAFGKHIVNTVNLLPGLVPVVTFLVKNFSKFLDFISWIYYFLFVFFAFSAFFCIRTFCLLE